MTRGTVVQVLAPLLALMAVFAVLRLRGLDPRRELALRAVPPATLLRWLLAFVVLAAVVELAGPALGSSPAAPWGDRYGALERVVRVIGMVAVAPTVEELVFRGLLFTRLSGTRLGPAGAVVATAALFAAAHVQYGWPVLGFVLVDGLFYGAARMVTGSVMVSLACHVLGNGYAAFERLGP